MGEGLFPALLQTAAARWGSAEALRHQGETLSFAEWERRARQSAAWMASEGVGPGDRVVLLLENSLDYAVLLAGVWAAGGVAIPLNSDTTPAAAAKALHAAGARRIIARARTLERLELRPPAWPALPLGARWGDLAACLDRFPAPAPVEAAAAPAMILFTSGTTGEPKGVVLTHDNLLANTHSIVSYLQLTDRDSIVAVLPFFHSFGNSVLLTHLAAGARLVIENRFAFPAKVVETLAAEQPTGFAGVPATYYILLHRSPFAARSWPSLRYICQAGGGMRVETVERLRGLLPGAEIFIMYGQTEASARLSYLPPAMLGAKLGSIGIPIPGVELRIADEQGRTVADGETGELLARGPNIMAGYLNDEAGTAEALAGGWLHTGDIGWRDSDGYFFLLSRKSDFIKSASYRVSPGEIEEVVAGWPGVEDVAVIGVEDELLGEAICACVVCPAERFDAEGLRRHCQERLPAYKTPKWVVREEEIPRTASGKKQYFRLREKYRNLEALRRNA